jgi:hypothetical protein
MAVFGQTTSGIHLGLLFLNLSTIVFVFLLGRKFFNDAAGVFAAGTYAFMSFSPSVYGFSAHATHFVVFFAVPGLLLLLRSVESGRLLSFFGSGLLLGMGFVMKQPGIAFCIFALMFVALNYWRNPSSSREKLIRGAIALTGGMLLPFLATVVILALAGVSERFWFWTVIYAKTYGTLLPLGDGLALFGMYFKMQPVSTSLLWLLGLTGLAMIFLLKPARNHVLFLVGFFVFSMAAVSAGLYFRPHYFVLALPALSLLAAAVVYFGNTFLNSSAAWIWPASRVLLALSWGLALYSHFDVFFQVSPETASATFYDGNPFLRTPEVAEYIRKNSTRDDTVAVLGSEPQIYFQSQRHSATGYIYVYPLTELHPYALKMQEEMIKEIETAKPKFIVVVSYAYSWLPQGNSHTRIVTWMHEYTQTHYALTAAGSDDPNLKPNANSMLRSKNTIFIFERRSS